MGSNLEHSRNGFNAACRGWSRARRSENGRARSLGVNLRNLSGAHRALAGVLAVFVVGDTDLDCARRPLRVSARSLTGIFPGLSVRLRSLNVGHRSLDGAHRSRNVARTFRNAGDTRLNGARRLGNGARCLGNGARSDGNGARSEGNIARKLASPAARSEISVFTNLDVESTRPLRNSEQRPLPFVGRREQSDQRAQYSRAHAKVAGGRRLLARARVSPG